MLRALLTTVYATAGDRVGVEPILNDSLLRKEKNPQAPKRLRSNDLRFMGLGRVELPTSRLSGVRSNHLSYRPLCHRLNACGAEFCKLAAPWGTVNRPNRAIVTNPSGYFHDSVMGGDEY